VVLVDTSVWIDFFQSNNSSHTEALEGLIRDNNRAVICGIVLQEILQGIKDDKSYETTRERLSKLPFIGTGKEIYIYASSLYRILKRKGITIPSVDTTIAAIAIFNGLSLFTRDEHFKVMVRYSELKLYNIQG
jgi:predicted nucleic acid-binding protein